MRPSTLSHQIDRRTFISLGGLAALGARASAQPKRRLKIGHTGITWGFKPDDAAVAIHDVASLGYQGYETFGEVLEAWQTKGGLKAVLDENRLPLISAYCNVNLTDPTKRADEVARAVLWAKLIKQSGGVTAVIGPNGVTSVSLPRFISTPALASNPAMKSTRSLRRWIRVTSSSDPMWDNSRREELTR